MNKMEQSFLRLEDSPYSCMEVQLKLRNKAYRRLVINNYVALYAVDEELRQVIIYRVLYSRMNYLK